MSEESGPTLAFHVVAAFLASGRVLNLCSHSAALIATGFLLWAPLEASDRLLLAVSLLLWPLQCWFALRVAIDSGLFRVLNAEPDRLVQFDALLKKWRLRRSMPVRSAAERCHAALKLWRQQLVITAMQLLILSLGIISTLLRNG